MSTEPACPAYDEGSPDAAAFVAVARLADVPPGTLLGVVLPDGTPVCLANVDGRVCALHDVCTHQAFMLSSGELADGQVECAWHGARFDAATGAVCRGPACDPAATYAVRVVGDVVEVGSRRGGVHMSVPDPSAGE